ncbi:MAG TPA: PP2C family protein-serine/threonine phosphatase [Kofleriaceae bacterium]|nr:PP2C family protein-serine/threonine phosphatase [Kofleriaceae bacterium]
MWHLLEAHRYEPRLVAIPFALALATLLVVVAYGLVMRGAPVLRATMLMWAGALVPYNAACVLAASTHDPEIAEAWYRIGVCFIPFGAAASMAFQWAVAGLFRKRLWWILIGLVGGLPWIYDGFARNDLIAGVRVIRGDVYFFEPGPYLIVGLAQVFVASAAGYGPLLAAARTERVPLRRRQMNATLWAMGLTWVGLTDVFVAYGWMPFPFAWLFEAIGTLFALRSLFFDDLLRARAIDVRAPVILTYLICAVLGGWVVDELTGGSLPPLLAALALVGTFVGLRAGIGAAMAIGAGERRREGPLDRLVTQFATKVGSLRSIAEIASHTAETIELGTGAKSSLIVPSAGDWSWQRPDGTTLGEDETPDPLLLSWMVEHGGTFVRDELELLPLADLRPAIEKLFEAHGAGALVTLARRDEIVGIVMMPVDAGRPIKVEELRFVERIKDRVSAALVFARMATEAQSRVAIEREVELAAAVQTAFVPQPKLTHAGPVDVFGSWEPTSRCGGDWWALYPLAGERVLVVIGDVTGHGVAAAMVTAAAKGACDAALKIMGDAVDLVVLMQRLDAAVRRMGAGKLHLTCFMALCDVAAGQVSFANAGHVVPYLCRDGGGNGELELHALVARGNPLGAGPSPTPRTATRPLARGDVIVWYTDGLVESLDPDGKQFGDRRMQRLLKKLDRARLDPESVHDAIAGACSAHRSGRALADDMTLVVARVRAEVAA